MSHEELKSFLEEKLDKFNRPSFIESDPISIPHQFTKKEDIEISGFLAATIAWGQRVTIINNAKKLIGLMDQAPHDFILNAKEKDLIKLEHFVHRTFNGTDLKFFIRSLQNIYRHEGGLEQAFKGDDAFSSIMNFRELFFSIPYPPRSGKHVSNPLANSSAKRLCMFLRWMIRKDKRGVDFGIWSVLKPSQLMCPLDVHSGNVARKLGILIRSQNDWKAVVELTAFLKTLDSKDPVKYDIALFGLGVFEKF
ncbi:MAG: TIGR02757 family protein [Bacteroidota bacterium]|nr:TIGR02757 family protein [Bacteroidota bacterium]